jgi:GNAT superfamily N-acetyltransferase
MPALIVRPAASADAVALASLAERLGAIPLPPWRAPGDIAEADAREMLAAVADGREDNEVLIAERDGEVVGCLHILETTDFFGLRHAHVSVLATTDAAEGTGVGRKLMQSAEEWTKVRGLPLLTLNVFEGNARARRFYERSGFEAEMLKYAKRVERD